MLEVIIVEQGQARDIVLDALRTKGYDVRFGAGGQSVAEAPTSAVSADPAHTVAQSVELLEGQFDEADEETTLYRFVLDAVEKRLIENAMDRCRGNQLAASRMLGVNRNTLRSRIRRLGISVRRGRDAKTPSEGATRIQLRQEPGSLGKPPTGPLRTDQD